MRNLPGAHRPAPLQTEAPSAGSECRVNPARTKGWNVLETTPPRRIGEWRCHLETSRRSPDRVGRGPRDPGAREWPDRLDSRVQRTRGGSDLVRVEFEEFQAPEGRQEEGLKGPGWQPGSIRRPFRMFVRSLITAGIKCVGTFSRCVLGAKKCSTAAGTDTTSPIAIIHAKALCLLHFLTD